MVTVDRPKATPRCNRGDRKCAFPGILKLLRFHFHPRPTALHATRARIASEPCFRRKPARAANRAIATQIGVSYRTVGRARQAGAHNYAPAKVVGRDANSYTATRNKPLQGLAVALSPRPREASAAG